MTALLQPDVEPTTHGSEAPPADLLLDGGRLVARLQRSLQRNAWLEAFLSSCAIAQLTADRLHPDPAQLLRAASYLARVEASWARAAATGASAAAATLARLPHPDRRRLLAAEGVLTSLTVELARQVLGRETARPAPLVPAPDLARLRAIGALLGSEPARLPACFHGFDLMPSDVAWLADQYLAARPGGGPVVVLGVRTSGSYLAPLLAAAIEGCGAPLPAVMTIRPGRPLNPAERRQLLSVTTAGGRVLIIDDPPGTGTALARTVAAVCRTGAPRPAITLVLPVFSENGELPPTLDGLDAVVKPYPAWTVHEQLRPAAVAATLGELLGSAWRVGAVSRIELPADRTRGGIRARYRVELTHLASGDVTLRDVVAEGAGLASLGAPAAAAMTALRSHLPRVYGLRDGLLFRDWLPEGTSAAAGPGAAAAVVEYVADREAGLATGIDPTPRLRGRDPAWEAGAALLARQYGPAAPFAQMALFSPLVRRLLATSSPAVLDGATDLSRWMADPSAGGRLVKVDFHQHSFSHLDLNCYDPASDLAGAAGTPDDPAFSTRLRDLYERRTGQVVDPERWLLHRLLHAKRRRRLGELTSLEAGRHSAAAVHGYLAEIYRLQDLPESDGPLVAIDLDGVLESDRLGYPASTPTGVLALRALRAHGFRPVLATGRSVDEVRDRCAVFALVGGVAEYGTVAHTASDLRVIDLRDPASRAALDRARARLAQDPEMRVDPGHRFALRVRGPAGPLPETALDLPELAALTVIHGEGQSDFAVAGLSKATALHDLASRLGDPPLALAVGDTASDLPMFAMADLAVAPANADAAVRGAGIRLTRHGYQSGLAEAVAILIGHRPGGCPRCRAPRRSRRTRSMLAALSTPANLAEAVAPASSLLWCVLRGVD